MEEMLSIFACLVGVLGIVVLSEVLWEHRLMRGEYQRKFVHVFAGSFIAFWPWFMSWRAIQFIGLSMILVMMLNRYLRFLKFMGAVKRISYGDILLALAILVCALVTRQKIFFAIAILEVALADGLAAAIGIGYGLKWKYKVFGQLKTVLGSMAVWLISLSVISVGGLFAHNQIPYAGYAALVLVLPPLILITENLAVRGLDNIAIPILVLAALRVAQTL